MTAEQVTSVQDLACQSPELAGRPITRWTHRELLDEVLNRGLVPDISLSHFVPKHSSWLNQIEAVFGVFNRKVIRGGNFESVDDLEEKLGRFVTYFNTTMASPMTWTYTGKPTQSQPIDRFCPPHRRITRTTKIQQAALKI